MQEGVRREVQVGHEEREGSGVVEARLLQNVVKLWIVKRLYEFVLFAQASRFLPLSLSSLHTFALLLSPSSFSPLSVRARMSTLFLLAIDLAFSMPCLSIRGIFFSIVTDGIHSFVHSLWRFGHFEIYRWTWVRFLSLTFDRPRC